MEYKNSSKYWGNKAVIVINKGDEVYADPAVRVLSDFSLNEIINKEVPGTIIYRGHNNPAERCAVWIEDNEWFPIMKPTEEDKYYLFDEAATDYCYEHREEYNEYFQHQLSLCERLVEFTKKCFDEWDVIRND